MPAPLQDWEKEIQDQQQQAPQDWESDVQQQPLVQRGEIREELTNMRQWMPWNNWTTYGSSEKGYMPEAIQSDYARKVARQYSGYWRNTMSYVYNEAMNPAWDWRNQHRQGNLDQEGRPYNQHGATLPYGAIEWTSMGNPSYRKEGQSILQGELNKYKATMEAPYGENIGEGYRYKSGPQPDVYAPENIQAALDAGDINQEQANELELIGRQAHGLLEKRIEKETSRVTGEPPGLLTKIGRFPKAAITLLMNVGDVPARGLEKRIGAINDIVATAQKELGILRPFERDDPEARPEWVKRFIERIDPEGYTVEAEDKIRADRIAYYEEYFKTAPLNLRDYYRESFVDASLAAAFGTTFALGHGFRTENIKEGGPLDLSLDSARITYTGIKEPLVRAQMIRRLRRGEDPIMLAEELEDPWAEGLGRSVVDPLWVWDIAAHAVRDTFRFTSYAAKFLGSNPFVPKALNAIEAAGKIVPEQMADDVYKIASTTLDIDNKLAAGRFRKFMDSQGLFALTSSGKQNRMTQMAGEVLRGITRTAGNPAQQADGLKSIVLLTSDIDAERKLGMILANNFPAPKMLYSEASRQVSFLIRKMIQGDDGIVDTTRFLKELTIAQELGEDAVTLFFGKKLDNAIEASYPSMIKRIAAHDEAVAWADEGLELTQKQFDALGDNIPKYIRAAVKADAGIPGQIKRGINTFFAYTYMGYGPGWFSRNIQNNVLTSVVDQGIEGMKYWSADAALDNASAWLGKIDVAGFGPATKMGITDLSSYRQIDLPTDLRQLSEQAKDIQTKLDKLPKSRYVPGKDAFKEAETLKAELGKVDLQLKKAMKKHKLTDRAGTGIPSLFEPAEAAERMTGANVVSAAGERAMRKQLKVGRALPDGKVLTDAGMPEDIFKLFVSDIIESKGDVKGSISRLEKYLKSGDDLWAMSGTSHIPEKLTKQLVDHKYMPHYLDIIRDGAARGEDMETVFVKWRAVIDGWDEMAAKVSDDVVTLADDVEGGETIIRTVLENTQAGIMDEGQVMTHFNYQNLAHQSDVNSLKAIDKFMKAAEKAGDNEALTNADDLVKRINQLMNERKTWADTQNYDVRASVDALQHTREEIVEEWHRLGLVGEPHQDITTKEFTDIRWRELWYEPDRAKREALRDLTYTEFHTLLEKHPDIVIDKYFTDIADTAYLRSIAYDDVLRMDEVRKALAVARKNEKWDYFTRTLAHQYGIPSVVYDGGKAIPQDAKILGIVNDSLGTEYVKFADIPEDELNQAFMRYRVADYARKNGLDVPDFAPLGKAAEEAGAAAEPYLSGLTKWTPEEYFDELEKWKAADKNIDVELFGEEGAKKYNAAHRSNMFATREETLADIELIKEMEASLTPEQLDRLHGVSAVTSYDELKDYRDAFEVAGMEDDLLYQVMKSRITKIDVKSTEMTPDLLFMQRATKELQGRGKNIDEILDNVGAKLVADIGEEDARFILEGLRQAPAPRAVAEVAEAVPTRPFVPPIGDNTPLMQRMAAETRDGAADLVNRIETSIHDNWGKTMPNIDGDTKALLKELKTWADDGYTRIAEAKMLSRQVGYASRDFALHSYPEKYGFDIALSYIYPYEFWHTRTYAKWMSRALTNPEVVATYGRYRGALEKIHAGAPDWWKYNINTNELLGIDSENPIFFNLESSLNPMYGMTGVDFNDPQKRVTWYATMVDNMSKWGPGMWTVWNWAVAGALAIEGETEAAKRWAGRLTPQSNAIKAALSLTGINISKKDFPWMQEGINEFDPMVLIFEKGIDPYEYQRVVRELGGMVDDGEIDPAQMIDAFMSAEGEHWDIAHERAIRRRAPGNISSFMLGIGFKGRNKTDQEIDTFYRDLFRVMGNKDTLSPEEYRDSMSEMFKGREWGQGLLIGRKRGYARDEALAYNVLSRIQPGQLDNILKDTEGIGVTYDMVQQFYATKGDVLYEWNDTDRTAFNNAIMVMQAVIDLPTDATKETWQLAKDANQRMYTAMDAWRPGIQDAISGYYAVAAEGDLKGWTQAQIFDAQQAYLDSHPYVEAAMDSMSTWKLRDPDMAPYYASIDGMERYYNNLVWTTLEAELGQGIFDEWSEYHNKMLVWDGQITQTEQLKPHVLSIKARRNALAEAADAQITNLEMLNPYVLEIDQIITDMWEERGWAIFQKTGTTGDTGKLWEGYYAIAETDKAGRRAYYNEHEAAFDLGKKMIAEADAEVERLYDPEQIAVYEQWDTMTSDRWDLYNFGYKDVLRGEGVTRQQFDDYEAYNDLFKQKNAERDAIFAASKGLSRYSEVKRELNKLAAKQMAKAQSLLPWGPTTRLREDVGQFGNIQQNLRETISGYTGRNTYYDYSWQDWQAQIDDPVMNLIEDYIVDGFDPPEALYDNLEYVADRLGILTPELLFQMIQDSYR